MVPTDVGRPRLVSNGFSSIGSIRRRDAVPDRDQNQGPMGRKGPVPSRMGLGKAGLIGPRKLEPGDRSDLCFDRTGFGAKPVP